MLYFCIVHTPMLSSRSLLMLVLILPASDDAGIVTTSPLYISPPQ